MLYPLLLYSPLSFLLIYLYIPLTPRPLPGISFMWVAMAKESPSFLVLVFPHCMVKATPVISLLSILLHCSSTSLVASFLYSAMQLHSFLFILITRPNHLSMPHFNHSTTPQYIPFVVQPTPKVLYIFLLLSSSHLNTQHTPLT